MIDAKHKEKQAKTKEEERKKLMQSLFAGLKSVQKIDEEGNGTSILLRVDFDVFFSDWS